MHVLEHCLCDGHIINSPWQIGGIGAMPGGLTLAVNDLAVTCQT